MRRLRSWLGSVAHPLIPAYPDAWGQWLRERSLRLWPEAES